MERNGQNIVRVHINFRACAEIADAIGADFLCAQRTPQAIVAAAAGAKCAAAVATVQVPEEWRGGLVAAPSGQLPIKQQAREVQRRSFPS
jgi:hypothetical protein